MSYISVDHLCKTFTVRKKREKGPLFREKETVHALKDVSANYRTTNTAPSGWPYHLRRTVAGLVPSV